MGGLRFFCVLICSLFIFSYSFSQITAPGLGYGNISTWFAIGLNQNLGKNGKSKWSSKSYIGLGRMSGKTNTNPFLKNGMFVLNQEFKHPIARAWQYGLGISYRRKDKYQSAAPFLHETPGIEQEFRFYGKINYVFKKNRFKLTPSLKQEFRLFYHPDFTKADKSMEFRTRFRLSLAYNLDNNGRNKLILISEQLFPISYKSSLAGWTDFKYKESRFSLFYSHQLKSFPMAIELGYANQLVGRHNAYSNHYFIFDIQFKNPFGIKNKS